MLDESRLDKLAKLLNSKNPVIRRQVCSNLGEIARSRPDEAPNLLRRVFEMVGKPNWDTRVAASDALAEILKHTLSNEVKEDRQNTDKITIKFDIDQIVRENDPLLGSAGKEFVKITPQEAEGTYQRTQIEKHLKIDPKLGLDTREWVTDDEIAARDVKTSNGSDEPPRKLFKRDSGSTEEAINNMSFADSPEAVFKCVLEILCCELFSSSWEKRHGAALALKQVVLGFGNRMAIMERNILMEKLLSVLCLDRFNDFVGSQCVAPVRETCAQVVGGLSLYLDKLNKGTFISIVDSFLSFQNIWECQQCGLLILKYFLPTSSDVLDHFLPIFVTKLQDENDEICNLTAQTLIYCCKTLAKHLWSSSELVSSIWKLLYRFVSNQSSIDENSAAGLLRLLETWLSNSNIEFEKDDVLVIVSFLDSQWYDTRLAAIQCLSTFCSISHQCWSDSTVIMTVVRTLYRRIMLEPHDSEIVKFVADKWSAIFDCLDKECLVEVVCSSLGGWLACLMVPDELPLLDPMALRLSNDTSSISSDDDNLNENESISESDMLYMCGPEFRSLSQQDRTTVAMDRKSVAAHFLSPIVHHVSNCFVPKIDSESPAESLQLLMLFHLSSSSVNQHTAVALIVTTWSQYAPTNSTLPDSIKDPLLARLTAPTPIYEETALKLSELNRSCSEFLQKCGANPLESAICSPEAALAVCREAYEKSLENQLSDQFKSELNISWQSLSANLDLIGPEILLLNQRFSCFLACALIGWNIIPEKLNPLIKPLMDVIKNESCLSVVNEAANSLTKLLRMVQDRTSCPNKKLVNNLAKFYCSKLPGLSENTSGEIEILSSSTSGKHSNHVLTTNTGLVLRKITKVYGLDLKDKLPSLYNLVDFSSDDELILKLRVFELIYLDLPTEYGEHLRVTLASKFMEHLKADDSVSRQASAKCLVKLALFDPISTLNAVLPWCLEEVNSLENHFARAGIVEFLYLLVTELDTKLIGLLSLLAPAILARMSDPEEAIRDTASACFGHIVSLMPLESGDWSFEKKLIKELEIKHKENKDFMMLLTNPTLLPSVDLEPIGLQNVQLRPYQKEGITWMWFLNRYHLHGILCDDMGLGKTIQTLCVMASSYHLFQSKHRSLIVCPRTLIDHWYGEIERFFADSSILYPIICVDRQHSKELPKKVRVVITSYESLRREAQWFGSQNWHYCILDEGHVIRNSKTQLFKAVIGIRADHRLILSGTPIQNSVLELWTLFEFLMPGYLGSQSAFNSRYVKPIFQSRDAKSSSQEADMGQKALESLHKQVLPFTLRRLKTDVLKELPPKIIQDYYCQLTPLQMQLYENVASNVIKNKLDEKVKTSAFQVLMYLRKLCDHPCMVLSKEHPSYGNAMKTVENQDIRDIGLSGKMIALKQLLEECGIVQTENDNTNDMMELDVVSRHRALIFCQFKGCINLIIEYLKNGIFGSVNWLRLDGTVPAQSRQSVVDQFNSDPSIDLLLLTTQIGGLGLNLTGADVVIFIDHDWNPVKDRQAIDRAHRLGQKRTVNVYRLITKGTLEEKIMRLQKFKTDTAQALIGEDNRSLLSMATDQLMDLLTLDSTSTAESPSQVKSNKSSAKGKKRTSAKNADAELWNLEELWDQSQYDEAFDVGQFLNQIGLQK